MLQTSNGFSVYTFYIAVYCTIVMCIFEKIMKLLIIWKFKNKKKPKIVWINNNERKTAKTAKRKTNMLNFWRSMRYHAVLKSCATMQWSFAAQITYIHVWQQPANIGKLLLFLFGRFALVPFFVYLKVVHFDRQTSNGFQQMNVYRILLYFIILLSLSFTFLLPFAIVVHHVYVWSMKLTETKPGN